MELGGIEQTKERVRNTLALGPIESVVADALYALRSLARQRTFSIVAILTLALGIGAVTAVFSTINSTVLRPLDYPRFEDIYSLGTAFPDGGLTFGLVSPAELAPLNESAPSVLWAAGAAQTDLTVIRDDGIPTPLRAFAVTEGFFDLFGLPMTLGSPFNPDHHVPGGAPAVVLSHGIWQGLFGGDPAIVGRSLRFGEATGSIVVTGVASPDLNHPLGADLWLSTPTIRQSVIHNLDAYVRVRPGTSFNRLQNELDAVMTRLAEEFPATNTDRVFVSRPLIDALVGDLRPTLVVVFALTGLLLLLACANVTSLLLSRGISRTREIALRTALGATRGRVVRQLLTESAVLTLGGAVAGLTIAWTGTRVLLASDASQLPRLDTIPFDYRVLIFAFFTLSICGLVVGLLPALRLAISDIRTLVSDSGRSASSGRGTFRLLSGITILEIAIAITLLSGTGWLVQSHNNLLATDPGFSGDGLVVFDLSLPFVRYQQPLGPTRELIAELSALPGVVAVDAASSFPLEADRDGTWFVDVTGVPYDADRPSIARLRTVSSGFFDTMGIAVVAGRGFNSADHEDSAPVTIVNEEFVKRYLEGQDAITTQLAFGYPVIDSNTQRPIVGVVNDVRHLSLDEAAEPAYYLVHGQGSQPYRQSIVLATELEDPASIIPAIQNLVRRFDPQLVIDPKSVPALVDSTLGMQRLAMTLMVVFGAIAVTLAAIGIYGIITFSTAHRTSEVATRLALGASPASIFWLLATQGGKLAATGCVLGLAGAYIGGRLTATWLYEVNPWDPFVLSAGSTIVVGIALCASAVSAVRAARVDPAQSFRTE